MNKHSRLRTIDFMHPFFDSDAAKKHHEYIIRMEKQETEEAKENRLKTCRMVQRRVRVNAYVQNLTHSFGPLYVGVY